jgi:glucose-1-phosphate thymidylyltransferase
MDSLAEAGNFVQIIEKRQGIKIAVIEEIAYRNGWIDVDSLLSSAHLHGKSAYGNYLKKVAENKIMY